MRNFYLFEEALKVDSIQALEEGLINLNSIIVDRDNINDIFLCNPTIWECDTTQGKIYELFGDIVNKGLQRIIPYLFQSFRTQDIVYHSPEQLDINFPVDCNGFTGFEFEHTNIEVDRRVFNPNSYSEFVINCLKFGNIDTVAQMRQNLLSLFPSFDFSNRAVNETFHYKNSNPALYIRLLVLFDDIPNNPFTGGIGETEVLKYKQGTASKRINIINRVTYQLSGGLVKILACSGHYD